MDIPPSHTESVLQVNTGTYTTCALSDNRILACWGRNKDYICDLSSITSLKSKLVMIKQVSISNRHACVISGDEDMICWGWNKHGQLDLKIDQTVREAELVRDAGG